MLFEAKEGQAEVFRNVSMSSKKTKHGLCHWVQFSVCGFCVEWQIDQFIKQNNSQAVNTFDVTPYWPSFDKVDYNPYSDLESVHGVLTALECTHCTEEEALNEVVRALVEPVIYNQRRKVKELTKSFRSSLFFDFLENISAHDEVSYLVFDSSEAGVSSSVHVAIEFPLLKKYRLHETELEYLLQFIGKLPPITVCLTTSNVACDSSFSAAPSLRFPSNHLPNLRHINLPPWSSQSTLYDYLPRLEEIISNTWGKRRRFVSELQRIAATVEFDPVDFTYISLSLRLTKDKHFILSIIELRIPPKFPSLPILVLVHDLLSASSYPLGKSCGICNPSFFNVEWSPERMAREYYLALCDEIGAIAFCAAENT